MVLGKRLTTDILVHYIRNIAVIIVEKNRKLTQYCNNR
jgi:hypothetical protein